MSKREDNENRSQPTDGEGAGVSRRRFIQIIGLGVVAPSVLAACSSSKKSTSSDMGDTMGGDIVGDTTVPVQSGTQFFPQSIASGDPTPESVILWARALDPDSPGDLVVTLEIATDEAFTALTVTQQLMAQASVDNVIKVKVSGLAAKTTYYYRFIYDKDGARYGSNVGRTKTAPTADDDVPLKFAFVSCQDYYGRYYNSYAHMAAMGDQLDCLVHLGDYIYETTGDPSFQFTQDNSTRTITLSKPEEALPFKDKDGNITHYAAKSVSNYRDLYKIYRSDKWAQKVHERVPMIAIWDDHEFSDDCWQSNATYSDGKENELEVERAKAAEQVYFEYMPIDRGLSSDGTKLEIGDKLPRSNPAAMLYRDFRFGKHMHLLMTDTRSYRPDHAIAENAFYAQVVMTKDELVEASLDPDAISPVTNASVYDLYIDIDDAKYAAHKTELVKALAAVYVKDHGLEASAADALATEKVKGNLGADQVNKLLADVTAVAQIDTTGLPRGMTIDNLRFARNVLFAADGIHARYLVNRDAFMAWRKYKYSKDQSTQDVFGATQEAWLRDAVANSTATWKVLGSSISFTTMNIDMRESSLPKNLEGDPSFNAIKIGASLFNGYFGDQVYLFNADQWDGYPEKASEVLDLMRSVPNSIVISGDIHSSYATDHGKGAGQNPVFEFTGTGISSEPFKGFVKAKVNVLLEGASENPAILAVISKLEDFLMAANPALKWASNDTQGYTVIDVAADKVVATFYYADQEEVFKDSGDNPGAVFQSKVFTVKDGTMTIGS
ncbi:MAG: alkaline phosphatase D family protein [Myxococcales bacterium]|nr:alkaline phosphatase D family protein [Myxococcales bacterium]